MDDQSSDLSLDPAYRSYSPTLATRTRIAQVRAMETVSKELDLKLAMDMCGCRLRRKISANSTVAHRSSFPARPCKNAAPITHECRNRMPGTITEGIVLPQRQARYDHPRTSVHSESTFHGEENPLSSKWKYARSSYRSFHPILPVTCTFLSILPLLKAQTFASSLYAYTLRKPSQTWHGLSPRAWRVYFWIYT